MKRLPLLACCVFIGPAAFGQYSYWYTESFLGSLSSNWTHNSSVTDYSSGLATTSGEGSLISTLTIPTNPPATGGMYEVQTTLNLSGSGGTFVTYVDATSNALSAAGSSTGTFYSIESSPTITSGVCSLAIVINKSTSGSVTSLASGTAACSATTVIRTVRAWNWIHVYVNAVDSLWAYDTSIATGQAGVGVAGSAYPNTMASVGLGVLEIVNPVPVNASSIGTSSFPDRVDIQWQGTTDNTGGSGLSDYSLYRDPGFVWLGLIPASAVGSFSDTTVTQGTPYTYHLYAVDYHLNAVSTSFTVTTAPTGAVDPRQVGVRPTGAYWGASPEQINLLSGNVNFSLPLLKAQGRSSGVGFSLSYNSQNWRQDGGGIWDLGRDVGFGYGWKLLAGSITPFWSDYWNIDHYTFTDSTGAEYRLSVNTGNVWSSTESIYLQYDATAGILHFPDGTFWVMGCESSGFEQDAGTYYPTVMEDTNGNQILLTYADGIGTSWSNSSARIQSIEDVRAVNTLGTYYTYQFAYNSDPIPHLIHVTNSIGTGEAYDFYYSSFTVEDPFTSSSFGTSTTLTEVHLANDYPAKYLFTADSSGQLTKAQLTHGGYLRWAYQSTTYTGSRNQMEATTRYLCKDVVYTGGGSLSCTTNGSTNDETTYPLYHESGTSSLTIHSCAMIDDPGGLGEKYWTFSSNPTYMGLVTHYQGRSPIGGTSCSATPASTALTQNDLNWTQDAAGNSYIGLVYNTLDAGQSYAAQTSTAQAMDIYGNVTGVSTNNYASAGGGWRYTGYAYLNSSNYTSRYIFNRLSSTYIQDSNGTIDTLATITYDCGYGCIGTGSATPREWDTAYGSIGYRGNPTSVATLGGTSTTSYDRYGNVASATSATGVNSSVSTTSATNYAAPSQITVGSSLTTSLSYAGNSFLGLTNETGPNGTTVDIGYDANARPTSSQSPFGATTTTAFTDSPSAPSTCTIVDSRWTLTTLDGLGRPLKTTTGYGSPCGTGSPVSQAEMLYDSCGCSPLGKLMQQWVPHIAGTATSTAASTTFTYDGIGRTLSKTVAGPTAALDTQGTTYYTYQGNTVTVKDPGGAIKVFTSDAFGNLIQVLEDPTTTTPPHTGLNYSTTYTYDIFNHLIDVSMPRSTGTQTRSWSYSGPFLTSATNPENGTVSYTYGTNNKVATRTDAKGQQVVYSYDSLARLAQVQRYVNLGGAPANIIITASGTPSGGSYPVMSVWAGAGGGGGTLIAQFTVTSVSQTYTIANYLGTYGNLEVAMYNPSSGWTLTIPSISVNGHVYNSNDPSVYDYCTGTYAGVTSLSCVNAGFLYQTAAGEGTPPSLAIDNCQTENYYYDPMPLGSSYPQNAWGHLSAVQYMGGYNPYATPTCETTFVEMYNYGVPGAPVGKQLTVSRGGGSFSLAATYTYDTEGRTTAETYPTDHAGTTASLGYTFDSMGRLNTMTDNIATAPIILGATYGPANELLNITGVPCCATGWRGESFTYNSLKQMTSVAAGDGSMSYSYSYSSTANNGKIQSQTDAISGETVTYTYDSLNRLAKAENQTGFSPSWGQSFAYDGFGNLTGTSVSKGSAPTLTAAYDVNNHAGGEDANGNPATVPAPAYGINPLGVYDVENRLVELIYSSNPYANYSYDPANRRVWRGSWTYSGGTYTRATDEVTFWSVSGRKLGIYNITQSGSTLYCTQSAVNYYFGGKLIMDKNGWVYPDRLGSIGKYYPYGIERPSATSNDTEKFTGYFRDAETGNDYAVNRYESPGTGRFLTPDRSSGTSADPGSWNKYAYTAGDPINRVDHGGTDFEECFAEDACDDIAFNSPLFAMTIQSASTDPSSPCSGQSFGSVDSGCLSYLWPGLFAGEGTCGGYGSGNSFTSGGPGSAATPCDPTPTTAPPECMDTIQNLPTDPGQIAAIQRILNENGFGAYRGKATYKPGDAYNHPTGPIYDDDMISQADYMIASVLVNRVNLYATNPLAFGYPTLLAAATGEANTQGIGIYFGALASDPHSLACSNLQMAIDGLDDALDSPYPGIYWWKAVLQRGANGTFVRKFRGGKDIRVGYTDFTLGLVQ